MKVSISVSIHGYMLGPFEAEMIDAAAEEAFTHGSTAQVWVEPADKKPGDSFLAGGMQVESIAVTRK